MDDLTRLRWLAYSAMSQNVEVGKFLSGIADEMFRLRSIVEKADALASEIGRIAEGDVWEALKDYQEARHAG